MAMQLDYRESNAAPISPPQNPAFLAIHRNTATNFFYEWNIGLQEWIAKPKVYRALLTQTGTDAPVATVLENTLGGTLVWTRYAGGVYNGTLSGVFPDEMKVFFSPKYWTTPAQAGIYEIVWQDINSIQILASDDDITKFPIEILVYP